MIDRIEGESFLKISPWHPRAAREWFAKQKAKASRPGEHEPWHSKHQHPKGLRRRWGWSCSRLQHLCGSRRVHDVYPQHCLSSAHIGRRPVYAWHRGWFVCLVDPWSRARRKFWSCLEHASPICAGRGHLGALGCSPERSKRLLKCIVCQLAS